MCYYTFLNEKLLQRYTFFMIYANLFAKKCGEVYFSANGRNYVTRIILREMDETFWAREGVKGRRMEMMKAPDDISANGRNFLAREGVKERRMLFRQMDETYESVLDAQREAMMKPRSVE